MKIVIDGGDGETVEASLTLLFRATADQVAGLRRVIDGMDEVAAYSFEVEATNDVVHITVNRRVAQ